YPQYTYETVMVTGSTYVNMTGSAYTALICLCETDSGEMIYMHIPESSYTAYFDEEFSLEYTLKGKVANSRTMAFSQAVTVEGVACQKDELYDSIVESDRAILETITDNMIFRFDSVDEAALKAADTRNLAEDAFHEKMQSNTPAYFDVVSISPLLTFQDPKIPFTIGSIACQCFDAEGNSLYLYIDTDTYCQVFDSEAFFTMAIGAENKADTVRFANPVRISGRARLCSDISEGLEESIGVPMVLEYQQADAQELEAAKLENQPPVPFSMDCAEYTVVFTEIYTINPYLTLSDSNYFFETWITDLVCRCDTLDGDTIYVVFPAELYVEQIDSDADFSDPENVQADRITSYGGSFKLQGVAMLADTVCQGLTDALGCEMVFYCTGRE
ncbi:MAG: hypothetical protein IKL38_07590, partial [Firmicutes bacterium]|nr:hypothetical protein [Bacillota bacterium]